MLWELLQHERDTATAAKVAQRLLGKPESLLRPAVVVQQFSGEPGTIIKWNSFPPTK